MCYVPTSFVVFLFFSICWCSGSRELCDTKSLSCTNLLWPVHSSNASTNESCTMIYYKLNSTICNSTNFGMEKRYSNAFLGDIKLKTYVDIHQTVFNVTFSKILWKKLRMRFRQTRTSVLKNTCRNFLLFYNESVPPANVLYYDCPWSEGGYEGHTFTFEYEAQSDDTTVGGKYIFLVPRSTYLGDEAFNVTVLQLFVYVNFTNPRILILRIQAAPERFNVSYYRINVYQEKGENKKIVETRNVSQIVDGELTYTYRPEMELARYKFGVTPMNSICERTKCVEALTPSIFMHRDMPSNVIIYVIGGITLLALAIYVLYFWRRQSYMNAKAASVKKLLIVYSPNHDLHVNVVEALVMYLRESLKLEAMLDILDVPLTESKDPFEWCVTAFRSATHVIVVASPEGVKSSKVIYENVFPLTMKLIRSEIPKSRSRKKFIVITLPYSDNVPKEVINFPRYRLMDQFRRFVKSVTDYSTKSRQWRYQYYSNLEHDTCYMDLANAVRIAENAVRKDENGEAFPVVQSAVLARGDSASVGNETDTLIIPDRHDDHVFLVNLHKELEPREQSSVDIRDVKHNIGDLNL